MMSQWIVTQWFWLVLGAILLVLEIVAPGFFLLFLGVAAICVGAIVLFGVTTWQIQVLLFAVFSLALVLLGRYFNFYQTKTTQPHLNRVMESYVGGEYPLFSDIVSGHGQVKIGDSLWNVKGQNLTAGTLVKIISLSGNAFIVEAV